MKSARPSEKTILSDEFRRLTPGVGEQAFFFSGKRESVAARPRSLDSPEK